MKPTLAFLVLCFLTYCLANAQCTDVVIADSSFEDGTYEQGPWPKQPGYWYRDDGANIHDDNPYHGDSIACSNGGGLNQLVDVDSNTTYWLSCYVHNALNDSYPSLIAV